MKVSVKKGFIIIIMAVIFIAGAFSQEDKALQDAIAQGNCEYLYTWMQENPLKNSSQYNRIKGIIEDYRRVNSVTSRFHNGKMESIVNTVPWDIQQTVFDSPATVLEELVDYLSNSTQNQFQTVKNLHDWICNNIAYDAEMFFSGKTENQDYESVLKAKKAVCTGYSNLLKEMCTLADIEAVVIHGFSKGFGYTGKVSDSPDHDWNAVKISGKWYLVDATWDAGILDERTFVKRYSTEYLFLESRAFLFTHLPEDNAYQFYAPCKTKEQFEKDPKLDGKFFECGFSYSDDIPNGTVALNYPKIIEIPFRTTAPVAWAKLTAKGSDTAYNTVWAERNGGSLKIEVDVPDTNEYTVTIFVNDPKNGHFPMKFSSAQFEDLVNRISEFVDDGELLFEDASYFQDSYIKAEDADFYYNQEDLFAASRNASLKKTFAVLNIPTGEPAFSFSVKADEKYKGCGTTDKYPYVYDEFYETKTTSLVSPKKAVLSTEKETKFSVRTSDFTNVVLIVGEDTVPFVRNNRTGNYELTRKIEDGASVTIAASREKRTYIPLWSFNRKSGQSENN